MSDAPKLFAKPKPGLKVPLPPSDPRATTAKPYLPIEGEEVENSSWWQRLAMQGDVDLTEVGAPEVETAEPLAPSAPAAPASTVATALAAELATPKVEAAKVEPVEARAKSASQASSSGGSAAKAGA